jgi:hypothetical protein
MTGINVNGIGVNPYANSYLTSAQNRSNATSKDSFINAINEVAGSENSAGSSNVKFDGDMVISQPPAYSNFVYNNTISNKSKDEMTMDEYKQWFMNEVSKMPVSAWYRSTCVGGALTITDRAFEKMKSDPEWENTVMNMVRKMYSSNGIMGSKMIGFQVIGASPEECYGEGIPVDNSSGASSNSNSKESWWKKRHERMEELMKEQEKEAVKKAQARRETARNEYLNRLLASQQRLHSFLMEKMQTVETEMSLPTDQIVEASSLAVAAYEKSSIILPDKSI